MVVSCPWRLAPPISRKNGLKGCSVLEVGAGCGLLGMTVAAMGAARVVLTDHPDAMPLLRRNLERNARVLGRDSRTTSTKNTRTKRRRERKPGEEEEADEERSEDERTNSSGVDASKDLSGGGGVTSRAGSLPLDWEDASHLAAVAALGPFDIILAADVVFSAKLVDPLLDCIRACSGPRTVTWVCLQERCPDAFAQFKAKVWERFDASVVDKEDVGFVDDECVLFELKPRRDADGRRNRREEAEGGRGNVDGSKGRKRQKARG